MHLPMKEKYVDEAVGLYMIFGQYDNGNVDVSDGNGDVFYSIPRPTAEKICEAQQEFRSKLYALLCKF